MKALLRLIIFLIFSLCTLCPVASTNAQTTACYPRVNRQFSQLVIQIRGLGYFVGSEWSRLEPGDFIAITLPTHPWGGDIFSALFEDVPGLPGYKYPVLIVREDWFALTPSVETEFRQYEDGTKVCYGYSQWGAQTIFIYAWSEFDWTIGEDKWAMTVTWGANAWPNDPGNEIDRTGFGTVTGETPKLGFEVLSIALVADQPVLRVFQDVRAWFWLETSSDLKTWKRVSFYLYPLPGTETWEGDIMSHQSLIVPLVPRGGYGPSQNFRPVQRK